MEDPKLDKKLVGLAINWCAIMNGEYVVAISIELLDFGLFPNHIICQCTCQIFPWLGSILNLACLLWGKTSTQAHPLSMPMSLGTEPWGCS